MRKLLLSVIAAVLLFGGFLSPAFAREGGQMQAVLNRLAVLEKENADLRSRVDKLEGERAQPVLAASAARIDTNGAYASAMQGGSDTAVQSVVPAQQASNAWSGFYVGWADGVRTNDTRWQTVSFLNPPLSSTPPSPVLLNPDVSTRYLHRLRPQVDAFVGYNVMVNDGLVAGIEADFAYSRDSRSFNPSPVPSPYLALATRDNARIDRNSAWSARGRLGWLVMPDVMIYGSGGVAMQQVRASQSCMPGPSFFCVLAPYSETVNKTMSGWTAGAGLEAKLDADWGARFEYRHDDYGVLRHTFFQEPSGDGWVKVAVPMQSETFSLGLLRRL